MNWITQALKEALMSGDMAAVASLQDEIKEIQLSVTKPEPDDGDTPSAVSRPIERIRRPRTKLAKDMEVPVDNSN